MQIPRTFRKRMVLLPVLLLFVTAISCRTVPEDVRAAFPSDAPVNIKASATDLLIYPQDETVLDAAWRTWGPGGGMNDRRSQDMGYDEMGYDHAVVIYFDSKGWFEQYVVVFPNASEAAEYLYLSNGGQIVYYGNIPEFATHAALIDFSGISAAHADDQAFWCEVTFLGEMPACQATLRYGPVITEIVLAGASKQTYTEEFFGALIDAADAQMRKVWRSGSPTLLPLPSGAPQPLWEYID